MAIITLDAGHGGKDAGAVNGKQREKDYALAIAKKVETKLKDAGHIVIMTRDKDEYLTLQQRCKLAQGNVFVSIHLNSAVNKDANGIETFHYVNGSVISKKLAENIQFALTDRLPQEKDRGVKTASYYVLKYTPMPAALVEVGFLSHQPTADKFNSYWYQDQIATAIADGIIKTV